ncbi:MAG: hypothetical protein J2P35_21815, partial [Actinobacteria bacterium]|nr:hypothetical protein [Actinomycetota bacterium]
MGTRGEGRGRSRAGRPLLVGSREGQSAPPRSGPGEGIPAPPVPGSRGGPPAPPPPADPGDGRPASPPPARGSRPRRRARPRTGLTGRTIAASIVLSLLVSGAFALLLAAISSQHHAAL